MEIIEKADLMVLVGFDVIEIFAPGHWDYLQPVVMLDEVAHNDDIIRPRVEVVADLADTLDGLAEAVSPSEGWNGEDLDS